MKTTLRIDNEIYRAAKAQPAAQGTTLIRFAEEALKKQFGHAFTNASPWLN